MAYQDEKLFECPVCRKWTVGKAAPLHIHDQVQVRLVEHTGMLPLEPMDELVAEVDRIEPWLRRTEWAPMTNMMIPSVLNSADILLRRIEAQLRIEPERAQALFDRLYALRRAFRRIR